MLLGYPNKLVPTYLTAHGQIKTMARIKYQLYECFTDKDWIGLSKV